LTTTSRVVGIIGNVKGTQISVSDTIAYLIGWGRLVLKWHDLTPKNHPVNFPETRYKWHELGKSPLKEFTITTSNILVLINSLDNKTLYGENWFEKYTLGK
jgi:hypothetical protein